MATFEDVLRLRDEVSGKLTQIASEMGKVEKKSFSASKAIEKFGKAAKSVGSWAQTRISLPLAAAGGAMIKLAMDMEQTLAVFETLLGSEKNAQKMVADIQKLAAETPLTTKGLVDNAKLLLNFGYNSEKIIPALRMLGDIAGGNQQRFDSLALAFAQVQSQGKLMGQDLLQMVNAGFNPLKIISEQTGESMARLKDKMSKGKISFEMIEKAMLKATSQGGKFYGLMQKQSQTAAGRLSTLQDNVELLGIKLGNKLLPHVAKVIEKLIVLVDKFDKLDESTQNAILKYSGLAIVVPLVANAFGSLILGTIQTIKTTKLLVMGTINLTTYLSSLALKTIPKVGEKFTYLTGILKTFSANHPTISFWAVFAAKLYAAWEIGKKLGEVIANLIGYWDKLKGMSFTQAIKTLWSGEAPKQQYQSNIKPLAPGETIADRALSVKAARLGYGQTIEDRFPQVNEKENQNISKIIQGQKPAQSVTNNNTNMTNNITLNGTVREEADINKIGQSLTRQLELAFKNSGSY